MCDPPVKTLRLKKHFHSAVKLISFMIHTLLFQNIMAMIDRKIISIKINVYSFMYTKVVQNTRSCAWRLCSSTLL